MTSSSHGVDQSSTNSEMTKPNCTITERHDQLLDELAETRHVSRSEALRTAIEDYSQSVSDDSETVVERLLKHVTTLADEIQTIHNKLDKLEGSRTVNSPRDTQKPATQSPTGKVATAVKASSRDRDLENDVYKVLSKGEPLSLHNIADDLDGNEIIVREALDSLVERGFVTCIDTSEVVKYRIQTPTEK